MKICKILGMFTLALLVSHCTKKPEGTSASDATATADAAKKPELKCSNGSEPQILTGTCKGAWSTSESKGKDYCLFTWGPKVGCPEGTSAMGYKEVCYGVSTHETPTKGSADDCLKKFGETPSKADYSLVCCKN